MYNKRFYLVRVVTPYFVAGAELDRNANIIRCAPILRKWRFKFMLIKLTKVYDGKLKNKYAVKYIEGTKLKDGSEWGVEPKKFFFANQKELVSKLNDFSVGDEVNVVLQHVRDKIYNIIDFKEVTEEDKENMMKDSKKSFGGGNNVRRADGGSRGDDTNRSASIYLAKEIVALTKTETQLHKMKPFDLLDEILAVTEVVNDFIKDGNFPPPVDGMVENTDDALEPPNVEEEDD